MSRGFVPIDGKIPAPDLSFVRLFDDTTTGWQVRGQYAIWTGASKDDAAQHQLLERIGNRVALITHPDGAPVFHKIAAGVPFHVQGLAGYWLTFDSDAIWLNTPGKAGRYAVLAVGGSAGKPSAAVVDWTCTRCGESLNSREFGIKPETFARFLIEADSHAEVFNNDETLRTCAKCKVVHPPVPGLLRGTSDESLATASA